MGRFQSPLGDLPSTNHQTQDTSRVTHATNGPAVTSSRADNAHTARAAAARRVPAPTPHPPPATAITTAITTAT